AHESVVGHFSYPLYLRLQVLGTESLIELLGQVSNEFYRAVSHQDFGRMASSAPELVRATFFQWLSWSPDDIPGIGASPAPVAPGLTLESLQVPRMPGATTLPPAMTDIEMTVFETGDTITLCATYRADLFRAETIGRMLREMHSLAERLAANPQGPAFT